MLSEGHTLLDTSENQPVFMIRGKNGTYIRLSPSAYRLYTWVKEGKDADEILTILESEGRGPQLREEVAGACAFVMDSVERIETRELRLSRGFLFHLPLLNAAWVARLSRPLTGLFHPGVVVATLLLALTCYGAVWANLVSAHLETARSGIAFGILFLSLLIHELGHAAACMRYDEPPSHIGLTLYLIFPAFYADVTGAWRLSRWQRVVVDLGGIYFQALIGCIFAILFLVTGSPTMRLAVMLLVGSILFQLNPIFRFDGYWLIADALGVSNLSTQPRRLLRHLVARLQGRFVKPLPWSNWMLGVLSFYAIASAVVWTYFWWRIWPAIKFYVVQYPHNLQILWTSGFQELGLWNALLKTLLTILPLAFLVLFLVRTFLSAKLLIRRIFRRRGIATPEASQVT